ncbi:DHS-like NAD/FAD-binding domain-containing protein [Dothidotthia symphoricarpi CBS 119687]|uniref:DHS-like NAD/FAD-binding domain-containing protein n=1 Tax=Dothidotthia symphoricarpi CBS 119687 TaxID=1392245 RepID=A0A6A6AMD8_9PLEO|nr:DHS-like NAD/FAD-binding domain-containing protein [Dothidotthia symphoricarpi CBS 119687]KAF2132298.1 DHS-like NAD/FAD-binding domain-containing protein [Dothidotthia symphoricarpi CBS 119687]
MPLLRIPYTDPLPLPKIIPASATTASGAIAALVEFLSPSLPTSNSSTSRFASSLQRRDGNGKTLLLTGAGISVASGLADYRGANGTYTLNKTYKPVFYNEFCASHEARKRYWARSFLGWTNLDKASPNRAHAACAELGRMGVVGEVITQNVDSFHPTAHPHLPTTELHGYLRSLVCITCRNEYPRPAFQKQLATLNPAWAVFLEEMLASGALDTENPEERRKRGYKANPDGDVDVPDAPYTTFRYPACPVCLKKPPSKPGGGTVKVQVDKDGAWSPDSEGGVLKPAVIMFGESIPAETKATAEKAVDEASRILVIGSSLATYSAWRLVKKAKEQNTPIGILNIGGVRGEEAFFPDVTERNTGREAVRCSENVEQLLPQVVEILAGMKKGR